MRFKEAADQLTMQHDHRDALFTRRAALAELQRYAEDPDSLTYEVSVFQLISALKRVLSTAPVEPQSHLVRPLAYSIEEQRTFVLQALNPEHPVAFEALVARKTKAFIIATFLAILEIAREGLVRILLNKTEHHTFYLAVCS
jgi:segregation and condensation protein A